MLYLRSVFYQVIDEHLYLFKYVLYDVHIHQVLFRLSFIPVYSIDYSIGEGGGGPNLRHNYAFCRFVHQFLTNLHEIWYRPFPSHVLTAVNFL